MRECRCSLRDRIFCEVRRSNAMPIARKVRYNRRMRKRLIAGNWKMNINSSETAELIGQIIEKSGDISAVDVVVAPPFTSLVSAKAAIGSSGIGLSSQNIHWEEKGAFTGEISAGMLKDIGCGWTIIGHSERRQYFGETDETVNKRTKMALISSIKPIVCIGETLEERDTGKTNSLLKSQLGGAFDNISEADFADTVIAYEPVWAIGTGRTATPEQTQEAHAFIRNWLKTIYSEPLAEACRILYGGSMKPANAKELLALPDVDGGLIGGASLKADDFSAIICASL